MPAPVPTHPASGSTSNLPAPGPTPLRRRGLAAVAVAALVAGALVATVSPEHAAGATVGAGSYTTTLPA